MKFYIAFEGDQSEKHLKYSTYKELLTYITRHITTQWKTGYTHILGVGDAFLLDGRVDVSYQYLSVCRLFS